MCHKNKSTQSFELLFKANRALSSRVQSLLFVLQILSTECFSVLTSAVQTHKNQIKLK